MAVSKIPNTSYLRDEEFTPTQATYTITYEQLKELIKLHEESPKFGILTVDHINDLIVKVDTVYKWYERACAAARKFKTEISGLVSPEEDEDAFQTPVEKITNDLYHLVYALREAADKDAIAVGDTETALHVIESRMNQLNEINESRDGSGIPVEAVGSKVNQILRSLQNISDKPETENDEDEAVPPTNEEPRVLEVRANPVHTKEKQKTKAETLKQKIEQFRNKNK